MAEKLFIGVFNRNENGTHMVKFKEEKNVINSVADLETHTLERIFTVDEFGEVEFYEVVFEGRLKLKKLGKGSL